MSDFLLFIIGSGVFAIATTATLLYGYATFTTKASEQGIGVDASPATVPIPVEPPLRRVV
jgi:hypothetical protein